MVGFIVAFAVVCVLLGCCLWVAFLVLVWHCDVCGVVGGGLGWWFVCFGFCLMICLTLVGLLVCMGVVASCWCRWGLLW